MYTIMSKYSDYTIHIITSNRMHKTKSSLLPVDHLLNSHKSSFILLGNLCVESFSSFEWIHNTLNYVVWRNCFSPIPPSCSSIKQHLRILIIFNISLPIFHCAFFVLLLLLCLVDRYCWVYLTTERTEIQNILSVTSSQLTINIFFRVNYFQVHLSIGNYYDCTPRSTFRFSNLFWKR